MINGQLQYLYDTIQQNSNYQIQTIHKETCRAHQIAMEMLRSMAETGMSSITVRALMADGTYRSVLRGDALSVYKCTEIYEYVFLPQVNCTKEYPVKYMYKHQQQQGYLQGLSHEITQTPTITNCPAPVFMYDIGYTVITLSNHSIPAQHLPYLPSPSEHNDPHYLPDISFNQQGIYTIKEMSQENTFLEMMKQIQKQARIDKMIDDKTKNYELTAAQLELASVLGNIIFNPYEAYFRNTISMLIILLILYILYHLIKWKRFQLGMKFPSLTRIPVIGKYLQKKEPFYTLLPLRPIPPSSMTDQTTLNMEDASINISAPQMENQSFPAEKELSTQKQENSTYETPISQTHPTTQTIIYPTMALQLQRYRN